MEVLKYEGQLGKGTKMFRVDSTRPRIDEYEFLCKNPHNSEYAILIDTLTQKPVQIYVKDLLSGSYYVNYKPSEAIGNLVDLYYKLKKLDVKYRLSLDQAGCGFSRLFSAKSMISWTVYRKNKSI